MTNTLRETLKELASEYEIMSEGVDGSLSFYLDDLEALIQAKLDKAELEGRIDELELFWLKYEEQGGYDWSPLVYVDDRIAQLKALDSGRETV